MMKNSFRSIDRCSRASAWRRLYAGGHKLKNCNKARRPNKTQLSWASLRRGWLWLASLKAEIYAHFVILNEAKNLKQVSAGRGFGRLRPSLLLGAFFALAAAAQEPTTPLFGPTDSLRPAHSVFPDTLIHPTPWHPDFMALEPLRTQPAVSMTSVVEIRQENLPRRIVVLDNNTLQIGEHLTLSNGQAWHWGPFLNAYLDARTLSFPLPR